MNEEEEAQLDIIMKAIEGCEALYMDDSYVIPISLNGNTLRIMKQGEKSFVSIANHVFEEEF
jgi:hypothetical protein